MSFNASASCPAALKSPILINKPGLTVGSHFVMYFIASLCCIALIHSSTNG